ncbi:hypothetical protein LJR225_005082 [Phenylobacterium sp. LjRoot225]|uniref:hypothetical protein n=1 Tax=Phenylobacterium sp. LjRoot225 TaxID=3342285 RepID=UPI003ED00159
MTNPDESQNNSVVRWGLDVAAWLTVGVSIWFAWYGLHVDPANRVYELPCIVLCVAALVFLWAGLVVYLADDGTGAPLGEIEMSNCALAVIMVATFFSVVWAESAAGSKFDANGDQRLVASIWCESRVLDSVGQTAACVDRVSGRVTTFGHRGIPPVFVPEALQQMRAQAFAWLKKPPETTLEYLGQQNAQAALDAYQNRLAQAARDASMTMQAPRYIGFDGCIYTIARNGRAKPAHRPDGGPCKGRT